MKFLLMIQIGFLYMAAGELFNFVVSELANFDNGRLPLSKLITVIVGNDVSYAALDISDDARVEITCTGRGDGSLPQWSINDKIVAAYAPAVLRSLGIAITPERIDNAIDENNNVFQTLVINGSASIRGTTVECVFEGEMIFPTTELVYLAALPPPENLTVSEGGLVQWQPPYSSLETEAVRYFLYNVRYSVEVTDTLTQETIMYNETTDTSFSFQPPADCIEDTVTVTARGATSVGDPAAVNMTLPTYEIPEPVDAERINATLQGNTLTVIVTAQYELTCRSATNFSIIYNGQYYNMSATLEIELIVGACSFDVVASNPAGNSDPTRVPINGELIKGAS